MYTPQFRFVLLISIFVVLGTTAQVLYSYSFGQNGLNIESYLNGVIHLASATAGGFFFIWLCSNFITLNSIKTTGFEGVFSDEYGTKFVFKHPIRLSKFLPDIIFKPQMQEISELESEILGFLSSFKKLPMDVNDPKSISLYDYAIGLWRESFKLPNSNPLFRIASISKYLGLVYTHEAKRKSAPLWKVWKKDVITYNRRCIFHPGFSSFILSTMPSFHKLDESTKKILLIAVRYSENPVYIPVNSPPITYKIYENVHINEQNFRRKINKTTNTEINPTDNDIWQFKQQARDFLYSSIRTLDLNPTSPTSKADGVYLGMGNAIIKLPNLLGSLAKNLTPETRSIFDLWAQPSEKHKAINYLIEVLQESNLLEDTLEGQPINTGINSFIIDDHLIKNAVLVKIEKIRAKELRTFLDSLPKFNSCAVAEKDENVLVKEIKEKSKKIDEFLKQIYA